MKDTGFNYWNTIGHIAQTGFSDFVVDLCVYRTKRITRVFWLGDFWLDKK